MKLDIMDTLTGALVSAAKNYVVLEEEDIKKALTNAEQEIFDVLYEKVTQYRRTCSKVGEPNYIVTEVVKK